MAIGDQELWKEVTPAELKLGYLELVGMVAHRRDYRVIEKLPNGNFKVHNPRRISEEERAAMNEAFPPEPFDRRAAGNDRRKGDRRG